MGSRGIFSPLTIWIWPTVAHSARICLTVASLATIEIRPSRIESWTSASTVEPTASHTKITRATAFVDRMDDLRLSVGRQPIQGGQSPEGCSHQSSQTAATIDPSRFFGPDVDQPNRLCRVVLHLEDLRRRAVGHIASGGQLANARPIRPESNVHQVVLLECPAPVASRLAKAQVLIGSGDHPAPGRGDDLAREQQVARYSRARSGAQTLDARHQDDAR